MMLAIIAAVCIFASCSTPVDPGSIKYEDIFEGLPTVETIAQAWEISAAVEYVSDGPDNSFKEPRDTYAETKGDCEDIAALMLAVIKGSGLGDGCLAFIKTDEGYHIAVLIDGLLYEAQWVGMYWPSETEIVYRMSLDEYVRERSVSGGGL